MPETFIQLIHINVKPCICYYIIIIIILIFAIQDADAAYMTKVELETKVNAISDELDFLRQIYDAVTNLFDFYLHIHLAKCAILKYRPLSL